MIIKYLEENADKVLLNETTNRLNGRNSTGTNCTVIDSFETIEEIGSICEVRLKYLTTITLSFLVYFGLVQSILDLSKLFWNHPERLRPDQKQLFTSEFHILNHVQNMFVPGQNNFDLSKIVFESICRRTRHEYLIY